MHGMSKKRFCFRSLEGKVDVIVGLDARGFLFGPIMAAELEIPFVPVKIDRSPPANDAAMVLFESVMFCEPKLIQHNTA